MHDVVLRLSLSKEPEPVIVCACRGVSDNKVLEHVDRGARSLRDLQRCGIGDQCGSCHVSLKGLLARCYDLTSAHAPAPRGVRGGQTV